MHPLFDGLEPLIQALMPADVRVVGGAVRGWLRHENLAYIERDLAVNLPPDEVLSRCLKARLPAEGTGLRWGTISVQLPDVPGGKVDITSLRSDIYTIGSRYPTVRWIESWEEDAARRDFTMNAVYVNPQSEIFDPFGGVLDLQHGLVKFIGDPATRVREDPLRMLRFFRFCAHYGLGGLTPDVADVLVAAWPSQKIVSEVRRKAELSKLKMAPQSPSVLAEMERLGLRW